MRLSLPLRENIAISNIADINADAKIRASLQNAGLPMEDVDLDSYLGKEFGGIELSGGEWQKIAIARAIFKDGDFYVLDEPTSALDPHMENKILENFLSLLQHSTSIVVSHRIGICKIVDRIVVLDQGKIIEEGSHDQLIKTNGVYAQMFYEQSKWYE